MKNIKQSLKTVLSRSVAAAVLCAASTMAVAADMPSIVSDNGDITMPSGFRQWVALGGWVVLPEQLTEEKPGAEGIHMVYAQTADVEAFRETGKWPDGAVVVKELWSTSTGPMTTGKVSQANEVGGYFVMIKDSTNRFADTNPLWGDAWGWAFFGADDLKKTSTKSYQECLGCHEPVRSTDLFFVDGYPVLKSNP